MDFDSNTHSIFRLNYHLVLVIKYRRRIIDGEISKFINAYKNGKNTFEVEVIAL